MTITDLGVIIAGIGVMMGFFTLIMMLFVNRLESDVKTHVDKIDGDLKGCISKLDSHIIAINARTDAINARTDALQKAMMDMIKISSRKRR